VTTTSRKNLCEFLHQTKHEAALMAPKKNACIIANVGRIAARVLNNLHATETAMRVQDDLQTSQSAK
jgi:hypothetical protein